MVPGMDDYYPCRTAMLLAELGVRRENTVSSPDGLAAAPLYMNTSGCT